MITSNCIIGPTKLTSFLDWVRSCTCIICIKIRSYPDRFYDRKAPSVYAYGLMLQDCEFHIRNCKSRA